MRPTSGRSLGGFGWPESEYVFGIGREVGAAYEVDAVGDRGENGKEALRDRHGMARDTGGMGEPGRGDPPSLGRGAPLLRAGDGVNNTRMAPHSWARPGRERSSRGLARHRRLLGLRRRR